MRKCLTSSELLCSVAVREWNSSLLGSIGAMQHNKVRQRLWSIVGMDNSITSDLKLQHEAVCVHGGNIKITVQIHEWGLFSLLVSYHYGGGGKSNSAVSCPTTDSWMCRTKPALLGKWFLWCCASLCMNTIRLIVLWRPIACPHTAVTVICTKLFIIQVSVVQVYLQKSGPPSWPGRNCLCKRCCLSPQTFLLPCPSLAPRLQWVSHERNHHS